VFPYPTIRASCIPKCYNNKNPGLNQSKRDGGERLKTKRFIIWLLVGNILAVALVIYRSTGDRYSVAAETGSYGAALFNAGDKGRARPYLLEAARLFEEMGLPELAVPALRAAKGKNRQGSRKI
jgi:hypothetical protein